MAQFITEGRRRAVQLSLDRRNSDIPDDQGFAAMGRPVPWRRRSRAVEHCKAMGLTDMELITYTIDGMAQALERDNPYEAMQAGCVHLDLTGTYRLMAVLLTDA